MNPLTPNDWPFRKFLAAVLTLQAATVSLLALDTAGFGVPFLTQAVGLIYALFAPGSLCLRILRLHRLGSARSVLYTVGVSLAVLMGVGLAVNFLYPLLGISRPLDALPLVVTQCAVTLVLCGIAFWRDRGSSSTTAAAPRSDWPRVALLLLLPLLGVIGATIVNRADDNLVLMVLMVLLATVPVIAVMTRWLPERLFPLAVFCAALTLLLHRTLISNHLWGADILGEFACYRTVMLNGVWQTTAPNLIPAYNTSLAVTVLPAALTNLAAIDGLWVFKLVFPALLALAPLAMYETLRPQFSARTALLAAFLLIAIYPFYTTFPGTAKQLVATVFLALLLLTAVDREAKPRVMLPLFGLGVVVSHYSMAMLLALFAIGVPVLKGILRKPAPGMSTGVAGLIVVSTALWYGFMAGGAVIKQFLGMGGTAVSAAPGIDASVARGYAAESHRLLAEGSANMPTELRWLYIVTQALIVLGAAGALLAWVRRRDSTLSDDFMAFAVGFAALLGLELVLPQFSLVISLDRIYPVALLTLAPFCIIGASVLGQLPGAVFTALRGRWRAALPTLSFAQVRQGSRMTLGLAAGFLGIFLLSNTGFIHELAGSPLPTSIALSRQAADFPIFTDGELAAAEWFLQHVPGDDHDRLYYDTLTFHLFVYMDSVAGDMTGEPAGRIIYRSPQSPGTIVTGIPAGSYIFLRGYNLRNERLALGWPAYQTMDVQRIPIAGLGTFADVLAGSQVVFSNDDARILQTLVPYQAEVTE